MTKKTRKIRTTATQVAKKKEGYKKVKVTHSTKERKKWTMIKRKGKWEFAKAASTKPTGPHTVCYYDKNTGFYDDCHEAAA